MKKYILLPAMMVAAMLSTTAVKAQEDVNPLLKYVNKENNLKFIFISSYLSLFHQLHYIKFFY